MINYINRDAEIILKASIFDQVLYEAVKICREIPEADAMAEDTFIDDRNNFRWKDVLSTGLRVFIAGIDGATGVAQVSGGGGTSNDMPWRDRDEDFLHFAHRVMFYAHAQYYPVNWHKRTQNSSYSFSYVYRIMGGQHLIWIMPLTIATWHSFFTELAIH